MSGELRQDMTGQGKVSADCFTHLCMLKSILVVNDTPKPLVHIPAFVYILQILLRSNPLAGFKPKTSSISSWLNAMQWLHLVHVANRDCALRPDQCFGSASRNLV